MRKKILSAALSTIILLLATPIFCFANTTNNLSLYRNKINGEYPANILKKVELADSDIPEILDKEMVKNKKHVNRLFEQEDANSIMFQNSNGKKTLYSFEMPIKYKDVHGKLKDKSNKLSENIDVEKYKNNYQYVNYENDIKTYFPKNLSLKTGIVLDDGEFSCEVIPTCHSKIQETKNSVILAQDDNFSEYNSTEFSSALKDNSVYYDSVFGESTTVKYTTNFNGFKEDIILEQYAGTNSFQFIYKTNGLTVKEEANTCVFVNPETNEKIFVLGDILVTDSKIKTKQPSIDRETAKKQLVELDNNTNHYYKIETLKEKEEYRITLVINEDFLKDPNTVYPVTIDPSIFKVSASGIQDANIYSIYNSNNGSSSSLYAGKYDTSTYGISRFLMKFPGLMSNSTFKNITKEQILNAHLYLRDLMCYSNYTSFVDAYMATKNWSESSVTKNNPSDMFNSYESSVYIDSWPIGYNNGTDSTGNGTGNYYPYSVKDALYMWKSGQFGGTANHFGILFKADAENLQRVVFGSAQNSSSPPFISIEYEGLPTKETDGIINNATYLIKNRWTGKYLDAANPAVNQTNPKVNVIAYDYAGGMNQLWKVSYCGNGLYQLHSVWPFSSQRSLHVTGSNYDVAATSTDDYFKFWIVDNTDGSFRIINKGGGNKINAMDVNGNTSSSDYKTNVISFEYRGADNQKWEFERIDFMKATASHTFENIYIKGFEGIEFTYLPNLYYECTVNYYKRTSGIYVISVTTFVSVPQFGGNVLGNSLWINHSYVDINSDIQHSKTVLIEGNPLEQYYQHKIIHYRNKFYSNPVKFEVAGNVKNDNQSGLPKTFKMSFEIK